jgi:penicillin-binding protein 1C
VLEFPFRVAAKTGTSKGFRDNWTIGFTREVTVAVWAGNFDGKPLSGSSGVTGAGPLFRDVLLAAMRKRDPQPLLVPNDLRSVSICPLSGARVGPNCPHQTREWFRSGSAPPTQCSMHTKVKVDPVSGLRAGAACRAAVERVFEAYPAEYAAWAREAGRPVAPERFSELCPGTSDRSESNLPYVAFPFDGAHFLIDPNLPVRQQQLVLRARASETRGALDFLVDGRVVAQRDASFRAPWQLERGQHRLTVRTADGKTSSEVHFSVD